MLFLRATATVILLLTLAGIASAQLLQTWDTKARERSQRLHSAALTALDKGQTTQAAVLLNQATSVDQGDAIAFNTLGLTLAKQGKYDEALDALQKAFKLTHSAETLLDTGMVYYLQHDYDAAVTSWNKAIESDGKLYPVYGDLGFAYIRKGDFTNAEDSFRKLIRVRPNSQLAYRGLALANYLSGEVSDAMKAADHGRTLSPGWQPVLLLLAKLEFLQGNTEAGKLRVREWQAATPKKKSTPFSMTVLGYPVQHDFHWDIFAADNFDNGNFLLARTRLLPGEDGGRRSYCSKGKMSAVLPQARAAAEAAPEDFYILREVGLLELANGQYSAAAEHFAKVLELCPTCRVDWLHLARAQSLAGKASEASYAVQEFRRQLPSEKISPLFLELANAAKGEAAPEKAPAAEPRRTAEPGGSGF